MCVEVVTPHEQMRYTPQPTHIDPGGVRRSRRLHRAQRLSLVWCPMCRHESEVAALAVHDDHAGSNLFDERAVRRLCGRIVARPTRHCLLTELVERKHWKLLARVSRTLCRVRHIRTDDRKSTRLNSSHGYIS